MCGLLNVHKLRIKSYLQITRRKHCHVIHCENVYVVHMV